MMRAIDAHDQTFGIIHDDGRFAQSIMVLHVSNNNSHVLDAILWHPTTTDLDRRMSMRNIRLWHRYIFGFDFALGSQLERSDIIIGSAM